MMHRGDKREWEMARALLSAVCEAGNSSPQEIIGRKKCRSLFTLRGILCLMSKELDIHPSCMAAAMRRSRSNIINQAKRYAGYVRFGDKDSLLIYEKSKEIFYGNRK